MSIRRALIICILILVASALAACGPSEKPDPTALPYTPQVWDTEIDETEKIVGDYEAGGDIYIAYCEACHSLEENVNVAGPSLFAAGEVLLIDYVRESIGVPHDVIVFVENPEFSDTEMPTNYSELLSEQEFEDIVAYIMYLTKDTSAHPGR
jgi:mono/diheme cytochrome c family protein